MTDDVKPVMIVTLPDGSKELYHDPDGKLIAHEIGPESARHLKIIDSRMTPGNVLESYDPGEWVSFKSVPPRELVITSQLPPGSGC